jgi:hypothetical protein
MYIQDQYVADLHNVMGGYSPHGSYAHIYINGLYWGMYYIHERPDHAWAAQVFGGNDDEYDAIKHSSGGVINNGIGGSATSNYNAMVGAAGAVASDPANLTKYEALCKVLDVDNFITYVLANWFTANGDWPGKNWYATHRNAPDGKWRFHSWDAEHTVENNGNGSLGQSPSDLHRRLANSAEYRTRFADIIHRTFFNGGPLTHPAAADLYRFRMNQIDRAIVGESARWGDNRQNRPHTRLDWLNTQNARLNGFLPSRTNDVLNWLKSASLYPNVEAPEFRVNGLPQHGGSIKRTDSLGIGPGSGAVYYTLDGADPRLPGGAVNSAHVRTAAGAVKLTGSARVKARALTGTTWSALTEAVFAVGPVAESLRISEIMFHPADSGNPNDPNTEYIELTNVGSESINLGLVRFSNGIDFTFPNIELAPGGYCLVVKSVPAFVTKYGAGAIVVGQYAGSLSNAGERLELLDAAGAVIHGFRFDDDWFDVTDGMGFSLTLKDPRTADPNRLGDKSLWRPSAQAGGSPGANGGGQMPEP